MDNPQLDLPGALQSGAADGWDDPSGQLVASEFFEAAITDYTITADGAGFAFAGQSAATLRGLRVSAESSGFTYAGQDAVLTFGEDTTFDGAYNALNNFCVNGGPVNGGAELWAFADPGQFQSIGQAANTLYNRRVVASAGSYALVGQSANALYGRLLGAASSGFTLTGGAASLLRGYRAAADTGVFALALTPAGLLYTRIMQSAGAGLALTGYDAATLYGRAISPANPGAYTYAGGDADLIKVSGIIFEVDGGDYALIGDEAQLLRSYLIAADDYGIYQITDQDAGFIRDYRLHQQAGEYVFAGDDSALFTDVFNPVWQRIFYVPSEARSLSVAAENSAQSVNMDLSRIFKVSKESRGFMVPAERGQ